MDFKLESALETWRAICGAENIEIEMIGGIFYAFGSELATLRLLKAYRETKAAEQGYSENLGTYYFSLEIRS